MIKAIIFDMDGVLVDSNMLHFLAYKKALEREGIEIAIDDYIKEGVGESDRHFFEKSRASIPTGDEWFWLHVL